MLNIDGTSCSLRASQGVEKGLGASIASDVLQGFMQHHSRYLLFDCWRSEVKIITMTSSFRHGLAHGNRYSLQRRQTDDRERQRPVICGHPLCRGSALARLSGRA